VSTPAKSRAAFVAVLGAPNAGKSTLINRLVGAKVSIVSPKVQTTRARVLGIARQGLAQIVFIDTPGIFKPRRRLDRAMVASAWEGARNSDVILLLVDSSLWIRKGGDRDTGKIIEGLKERKSEAVLVLNKVDKVDKEKLLALAGEMNAKFLFSAVFMISATKGDGVGDLMDHLAAGAAEGPWHFPEDQVSDQPERFIAAEITREQLYRQLHQELPYAAHVETEKWEDRKDGSIRIDQVIFVEKPGQKGIVLGNKGARIKSIGEKARKELESLFGCRVHLFLFIKVRGNWGDDPACYRDLGLDFNA
jgi:GTP-binding protein Era